MAHKNVIDLALNLLIRRATWITLDLLIKRGKQFTQNFNPTYNNQYRSKILSH